MPKGQKDHGNKCSHDHCMKRCIQSSYMRQNIKRNRPRCTLPQSSSVQRSEHHCTCHHDLRVALIHDSRHVLATTKLGVAIKEATREHARYLIVTWNGNAYDFAAALAPALE